MRIMVIQYCSKQIDQSISFHLGYYVSREFLLYFLRSILTLGNQVIYSMLLYNACVYLQSAIFHSMLFTLRLLHRLGMPLSV